MGSGADRPIAFATSAAVAALTDDDLFLARELEARGATVHGVVWDATDVAWSDYRAVVVRSTWDYHLRYPAFLTRLDALSTSGSSVFNSLPHLRWNSHKTYLRDLARAGVPVVATRWVDQHEQISLARIVEEEQWERFVVKPSVSASAHRTWRGSMSEAPLLEGNFRATVTHGGVLVQPFLSEITEHGEWSLLFYGGVYSHAVIKRPRSDDFRVQKEHGGTSTPVDAPPFVIAGASSALGAAERLHGPTAYARVDGCVVNGQFLLMELELIEPDLFLRSAPDAPRKLADALAL